MKKHYYAHVDGLRALAVLSVIFFHLDFSLTGGGYVGVDIFFVISGFLITLLLRRELQETGTLRLGEFYVRRIKRIMPALVVVLATSFLFSALVFSPNHLQTIAGSLSSALFGLSNFYFWFEADYFDTSTKLKPFMHTWSLGVEEQFYLFWSLALFTLYKLKFHRVTLLVIIAAFFSSIFLNFILADGNSKFVSTYFPQLSKLIENGKSALFYLLPFRVYEFAIGALLAFAYHFKIQSRVMNEVLFILGLALIVYAITQFNAEMIFPYFYGLVPTIGAALIIYSGRVARSSVLLSNKFMVGIGLISYSLYLVHWPIISFYHYLEDEKGLTFENQITIIILTVIFSYCLYKFIETPFRRANYFKQSKLRFASSLGLVALILGLSVHAYKYQGWAWRVSEPIVSLEKMEDSSAFHKKYYGGTGYPYYGPVNTQSAPDIVVLGDSHGRHYAEGLYKILAEPNGLSLYIASGNSCFHLPRFTRTSEGQNWDQLCPKGLAVAKENIDKAKNPPVVVVSHAWVHQMDKADILDDEQIRIGAKVSIEHIKQGVLDLKEFLGEAELVVIGNIPGAGANLYDVFTRPRPLMFSSFNPEDYLYRDRDPKREDLNAELKRLAEETGSFTFIDPFDYLCDDTRCRNTDDQRRLIYSDQEHLSKYGSIFLMDAVKDQLLYLVELVSI